MKSIVFSIFILVFQFVNAQSVGDFYQGGVVFYINSLGNGLIVDTSYIEASFNWTSDTRMSDWGPYAIWVSGTENEYLGSGFSNTQSFESAYPNQHYAANICFNSNSAGYSDWFLPSKDELWAMMNNIDAIDSTIKIIGGDTITDGFHWSSTQVDSSNDVRYAHGVVPFTFFIGGAPNGPLSTTNSKNTAHLVRSVRCINGDCNFNSISSILKFDKNEGRVVDKIVDLIGREVDFKYNRILFFIYNDGTVEKKIFPK